MELILVWHDCRTSQQNELRNEVLNLETIFRQTDQMMDWLRREEEKRGKKLGRPAFYS